MTGYRDTVDIYLLRVLHTLLVEGSVTRTAVRLNQSQPAISAALRRLRDITGDPLLVRAKSGMVPTERGLALLEPVTNALHEISRIAIARDAFDPKHSIRSFRIGSPDYLNILFVPSLVERFRAAAPHARLELHPLTSDADYEESLASGTFDLVLGNWPEPPKRLQRRTLFSDEVVCLLAADHPLAQRFRAGGTISEADYLTAAHLAPTPYSPTQRGPIESHLTRARLKRNVQILVPYFSLAPPLLLKTDLIFTTTRRFAEFHARHLPLAVVPSPIDFPAVEYYLLWHPRGHLSDEVQWLINLVASAV
ncbi:MULTISPECIES: LysR substrate-binding domain-containing protein [Acidiphilium]|uniref:Transcriptional regulator, LysR family n=2 Tax=Acidiphilium TaxID=522 RepID=A5FXP4_ACICJ|nr:MULTISPECIES: LysR substrate-binding domain-containing protein [Acidiphilium]MBU6357881.1 LysR family transcriptional regulator [Rhodospirillales bacterium]ABQ30376.1 transcriptional regulator, LysR family [Acidiphilium cryptum JF-5]EGO96072.1 LysR family transcriptional regulator [Acidiphilium sp. PM]KDM66771.1 HTH-type transcriptional activator NagR [Acidiphilium sp. JA12-A1]MBS3022431.1 LysR family transcriptional regulator [Acidiphilium multivorum]